MTPISLSFFHLYSESCWNCKLVATETACPLVCVTFTVVIRYTRHLRLFIQQLIYNFAADSVKYSKEIDAAHKHGLLDENTTSADHTTKKTADPQKK